MSTGYQIHDQHATYYLTLTIVDWVDIFTRPVYKNIIIDSLNHCITHKGLQLYGYVIMTNHLHLIARAAGTTGLSDILRDFKKFTASSIIETIQRIPESRQEWLLHRFGWNAAQNARNSTYQVWQHTNHAICIETRPFLEEKLRYLHQNPVKAGIVTDPEDYTYSSACELSGRGSKVPVVNHYN